MQNLSVFTDILAGFIFNNSVLRRRNVAFNKTIAGRRRTLLLNLSVAVYLFWDQDGECVFTVSKITEKLLVYMGYALYSWDKYFCLCLPFND